MRKITVLALCLFVTAAGAFALDKTVGGGVLYTYTTNYGKMSPEAGSLNWSMTRNCTGAFMFFGLTQYVETNLAVLLKDPDSIAWDGKTHNAKNYEFAKSGKIDTTSAIQFGVYGKYPLVITESFVFFPTAGIDVELTMSRMKAWWHDFWFRGGIGVDYFFNEKVFLRGHGIYGGALSVGGDSDLGLKGGHGLLLKVGIGYML